MTFEKVQIGLHMLGPTSSVRYLMIEASLYKSSQFITK